MCVTIQSFQNLCAHALTFFVTGACFVFGSAVLQFYRSWAWLLQGCGSHTVNESCCLQMAYLQYVHVRDLATCHFRH